LPSREDNSDEELTNIIRKIVSVLEQRNGIKLVGPAKERVVEGFLHSTRAIFFLSLLDLNRHRLDMYPPYFIPNLGGKWEPVSPVEIEHTRLALQQLTKLRVSLRHEKIAHDLEGDFGLSSYVEHIIKHAGVDKEIAELVIAVESSFLEALRKQGGEEMPITRTEEVTEEQVQKKERDKGKWFG
jgi:hypothetical protein